MKIKLIRLGILFLLALLWEALARVVHNPKHVPSLAYLVRVSYPSLANFSDVPNRSGWTPLLVILHHALLSLYRIIAGTMIGLMAGALLAAAILVFKRQRKGNLLVLSFFRSIPLLALIPLFYHWYGGKEIGMILYISFAVTMIFSTGLYHAATNIPPAYLQQARLLGSSRGQLVRYVAAYAILPEIYATVINLAGLTWAISLASEYLAGTSGLGYLIFMSYYFGDMGHLFLLSLVYCLLGMLTYWSIRYFFKFFIKWV